MGASDDLSWMWILAILSIFGNQSCISQDRFERMNIWYNSIYKFYTQYVIKKVLFLLLTLRVQYHSPIFLVLQPFFTVIEDDWLQSMSDVYKSELIKFMHFHDNIPYSRGHEFTTGQLLTITTLDLCAYMNFQSCKETHPSASA